MKFVCEPKSCLCCIAPKTGSLILGFVGAICSIFGILAIIAVAFSKKGFAVCQNDNLQEREYPCMEIGMLLLAVSAIVAFVNGAVSISLIYGLNKGIAHLMIPYVILNSAQTFLTGLFTVALAAIYGVNGYWVPFALVLIVGTLIVALWVHFLMIIYITRKEIIVIKPHEVEPSTTDSDIWKTDIP
ncbi:uncharacterized protein LOC135219203 isoform X1 [Macrobrachium nipponense]|uniref:uncharacterized protein LOC135219203 isoform X1 n=1 Tax=Macrobrachium nipponense TaxID=159736 RepID=UPI0030C82893